MLGMFISQLLYEKNQMIENEILYSCLKNVNFCMEYMLPWSHGVLSKMLLWIIRRMISGPSDRDSCYQKNGLQCHF